MAVIVQLYSKNVSCVFSKCGHAKASFLYVHEFRNYSDKPVCDEHKRLIEQIGSRK